MDIKIHYRHISHGEESTTQIRSWISDYLERALHLNPSMEQRGLVVDAYFSKNRERSGSSKTEYECHMLARAPWLKKELFAKVCHEDFWTSMTEAGHVLKKQIVKDRLQRKTSRQKVRENFF